MCLYGPLSVYLLSHPVHQSWRLPAIDFFRMHAWSRAILGPGTSTNQSRCLEGAGPIACWQIGECPESPGSFAGAPRPLPTPSGKNHLREYLGADTRLASCQLVVARLTHWQLSGRRDGVRSSGRVSAIQASLSHAPPVLPWGAFTAAVAVVLLSTYMCHWQAMCTPAPLSAHGVPGRGGRGEGTVAECVSASAGL